MIAIPLEVHRAQEPRATYAVALMLACALVALLLIAVITARHEAQAARRETCAAELRAVQARHPGLVIVRRADPCVAWKAVRG